MAELRPPQHNGAPAVDVGKQARIPKSIWLFLALAVLALIIVLWVLPVWVAVPEINSDTNTEAIQTQTSVPVSSDIARQATAPGKKQGAQKTPQNPLANNHFKLAAEKALQQFLRLQAQPDLGNAEVWMPADWQAAEQAAAAGDKAFGQGKFSPALDAYTRAVEGLQGILDKRASTLADSLTAAWQFLQKNAVADAQQAFSRVLAMESDHADAQLGLSRAAVREEVLQQMRYGQQAELSEQLNEAVSAYQQALQLDPLYNPATEAMAKVNAELTRLAFANAMGKALKALDAGALASAGSALLEAESIKPGDASVASARQRLLAARKQAGLASLRQQAERLVKAENWAAALDKYQRALQLDPQAAFARNGLDRAMKRLKLHRQLDHYLTNPSRLYSPDPLNNALALLHANEQLPANEPKLVEKLKHLQTELGLAQTELPLLILSDGLTEVTLYKRGRLGQFTQKDLRLRPGQYTFTGVRKGYRDVLIKVNLLPNSGQQTLLIRAEEKF